VQVQVLHVIVGLQELQRIVGSSKKRLTKKEMDALERS